MIPETHKIKVDSPLGQKGNIYFPPANSADPSLSGVSAPGDTTRAAYLNAIYASTTQDGASGDKVQGKLHACKLTPTLSMTMPTGVTWLSAITTSQTLAGSPGRITHYYAYQGIDLNNNHTLTIDTTAGPVHLWLSGTVYLRNTAKILNIRTDGKPPRVGDFWIRTDSQPTIVMYDQSCIQNAFIYNPYDNLELLTTGSGCPGGRNTNFEGVVWAEEILAAKNAATDRNIPSPLVFFSNAEVTPGVTSGIYVPDDLTSLVDLLQYIDWPVQYQFGEIKSWSRQRL